MNYTYNHLHAYVHALIAPITSMTRHVGYLLGKKVAGEVLR